MKLSTFFYATITCFICIPIISAEKQETPLGFKWRLLIDEEQNGSDILTDTMSDYYTPESQNPNKIIPPTPIPITRFNELLSEHLEYEKILPITYLPCVFAEKLFYTFMVNPHLRAMLEKEQNRVEAKAQKEAEIGCPDSPSTTEPFLYNGDLICRFQCIQDHIEHRDMAEIKRNKLKSQWSTSEKWQIAPPSPTSENESDDDQDDQFHDAFN